MCRRHLSRHGTKPVVQRNFLELRCCEHLQEDEILVTCVLDIVTGHCRHIADVIGAKVHRASILFSAEEDVYKRQPDMRGYGDSDKPAGDEGYDSRALAHEFRALVRQIEFGAGQPLLLAAHDMGAPPALLWAADHPEEVAGLLYMEVPVMLAEVITKIISYTPQAMKKGSMWWWILPLASDVLNRLIVGHEREFLTWFYEGATANPASIEPGTIEEYLRTFSGIEGVLGANGVYRAAFTTMDQTCLLYTSRCV